MYLLMTAVLAANSAASAEQLASASWSRHYRGDTTSGAAWADGGRCWVGISDGKTPAKGRGRLVVGEGGAFYNLSWDAEHKAPDDSYYVNASWFGKGKTWAEAFRDADSHGYPSKVYPRRSATLLADRGTNPE